MLSIKTLSTSAWFWIALVTCALSCSPKGKPAGDGGGNPGGNGDATGSNNIQNGTPSNPAGGSDVPTAAIPNPPSVASGNGSGGRPPAVGPQSTGSSSQGQTEAIGNPNPNVSTPQGCTMQRRSNILTNGTNLKLDDGLANSAPSVPPSVAVEFKRSLAGKETTSRCVAVLTMREYPDVALDYKDSGFKGTKATATIAFPRISMAAHCARTLEGAQIKSLIFRSTIDPNRQTVFDVNNKDSTFSNVTISGNRFFDLNEIKFTTTDDKCSNAAREANRVAPGSNNLPCFTLVNDQLDILTERERKFIKDYNFDNVEKPFSGKDYFETEGNRLLAFPLPAPNEVDWVREYSEGASRNMTTLAVDDNQQAMLGFQSEEDVFKHLNRNLVSIKATRLVRNQAQTVLPVSKTRPPGGWETLLKVYGDSKPAQGGGQAGKNTFVISAIGLINTADHGLKEGDSGTHLVGEFLEVKPPLLKVRSYRQVLGVLSTVGGKDVCAGDDLLCCDRS